MLDKNVDCLLMNSLEHITDYVTVITCLVTKAYEVQHLVGRLTPCVNAKPLPAVVCLSQPLYAPVEKSRQAH